MSPALVCNLPAVSIITTLAPIANPSWTALNATAEGSEFSGPTTTGTELLSPQVCNC